MTIPLFQVDAFSHELYKGNPAAVCILPEPATDLWMSNVAAEMNLSETAFVVPDYSKQTTEQFCNHYWLKWFTPSIEVDLCGHATLAAAKVLYDEAYCDSRQALKFYTRGGILTVQTQGEYIELTLPTNKFTIDKFCVDSISSVNIKSDDFKTNEIKTDKIKKDKIKTNEIKTHHDNTHNFTSAKFNTDSFITNNRGAAQQVMLALGISLDNKQAEAEAVIVSSESDFLLVLNNEQEVLEITPDYVALAAVNKRLIIISAKSGVQDPYDFVVRVFAPTCGINEDPVTGSAYCLLGPYWSQRLHTSNLTARQVSKRGGDLTMKVFEHSIVLRGQAIIVFKAELYDNQ
ncbi:Phenazine biosynthesis protein PhzF like [hydrothermal vent metagenome]|uniref:Phenazine biosynthesis protein PhzF like n=1 Tax=hydrothermal vent metagenome TaxID=652676 RepID=A0A3B0YS09_9ZZZZ